MATTASTHLMRLARPLAPSRPPYYLHTPGEHPAEQAPGWYLRDDGGRPVYLGAQTIIAARAIDQLKQLAHA